MKTNKNGFKPVNLTISREEIESCDIAPALKFLNKCIKTPKAAMENAGRVSIQVTGYEKGERVQEHNRKIISKYFSALDKDFGGWFHVCNRWDNTLRMVFLACTPLKPLKAAGSDQEQLCFDLSALRLFISRHNINLRRLHHKWGISDKATDHVMTLMQAYYDNFFLKLKEEKESAY